MRRVSPSPFNDSGRNEVEHWLQRTTNYWATVVLGQWWNSDEIQVLFVNKGRRQWRNGLAKREFKEFNKNFRFVSYYDEESVSCSEIPYRGRYSKCHTHSPPLPYSPFSTIPFSLFVVHLNIFCWFIPSFLPLWQHSQSLLCLYDSPHFAYYLAGQTGERVWGNERDIHLLHLPFIHHLTMLPGY